MKKLIYFIFLMLFTLAMIYVGIHLQKSFFYKLFYRQAVRNEIAEMVKPDCLED